MRRNIEKQVSLSTYIVKKDDNVKHKGHVDQIMKVATPPRVLHRSPRLQGVKI